MIFRLPFSWYDLKDSLWFRPAIMTAIAVVLAFVMVQVDHAVLRDKRLHYWWLFEGGAEGARGVLSAIAGTMMTIATTAFSITIVALQLASSQFSPRILRRFTGDRGNQLVLGAFIATFVYSLLVLRSVRSASADAEVFVPSASISLALFMALGCIASLIYFFHHATRTIQASVVIDRATGDTFRLIEQYLDAEPDDHGAEDARSLVAAPPLAVIRVEQSGYLQGVHSDRLVDLARRHDVVLSVHPRIGDHLFSGGPLVTVHAPPARRDDGEVEEMDTAAFADAVRAAFAVGLERTLEQDVLLGFQQLADIGLKALSPGINDPTTAMLAIDRLGESLIRIQDAVSTHITGRDDGGVARAIFPRATFEMFLQVAYQQMRHYGAGDPFVAMHLVQVLEAVCAHASADHRAVVAADARHVVEDAARRDTLPSDMERIRAVAAWAYAERPVGRRG